MAKKQVIRLTESDLHRIIKESVNQVLNEETKNSKDPYDIVFLSDYTPKDIIDGQFDDMIWDDKWCDEMDYYGGVEYVSAIVQRKMILDKDYAMKYGIDPSVSTRSPFWFESNRDMNPNMYDSISKKKKFSDYSAAQLGRTSKARMHYAMNPSDDNVWKGLERHYLNKQFNGRNPDTQKLHTKGSLNRELRAMDKAKK